MKKRRSSLVALCVMLFSLYCVAAQEPVAKPTPVTPMQHMEARGEALNAKSELLYHKLRDLTEFQQYIQVQKDIVKLQQDYQAEVAKQQEKTKKPDVKK